MRLIRTFILHLYVDADAPERLCGDIRVLDDKQSLPFKDFEAMELLLRRLAGKSLLSKAPQPADEPHLDQ